MSAKLSKDQELADRDLFVELPPLGYKDDRIPKIPEFTFTAAAQYEIPGEIVAGVRTTLDATFSYVGKSYNAFNEEFAGYRAIGDFSLLNLGVNFAAGPATFRVFANNVTDTAGAIDWNDSTTNVAGRSTNRPRTIGVMARYAF